MDSKTYNTLIDSLLDDDANYASDTNDTNDANISIQSI